jgi:hypothetical protein
MYRMKCCFGGHLKSREIENQRTETRLRSKDVPQDCQPGFARPENVEATKGFGIGSKNLNQFARLGLRESNGIGRQGTRMAVSFVSLVAKLQ